MNYSPELLLTLTAHLSQKYTHGESSSVTFETAQMLMRAVVYTLDELQMAAAAAGNSLPDAALLYQQGQTVIYEKARLAQKLYNHLIEHFEDYGYSNYRSTLLQGMPAFFLHYDPVFKPQDHILTLDYPLICPLPDIQGIDRILFYLKGIRTEAPFLSCIPQHAITGLMSRGMPGYRTLYYDNLSYPVLLCALGCHIAGKDIRTLTLFPEDIRQLELYFSEDTPAEIAKKLQNVFLQLFGQSPEYLSYFSCIKRNYAFRIYHGMQHHTLDAVMTGM